MQRRIAAFILAMSLAFGAFAGTAAADGPTGSEIESNIVRMVLQAVDSGRGEAGKVIGTIGGVAPPPPPQPILPVEELVETVIGGEIQPGGTVGKVIGTIGGVAPPPPPQPITPVTDTVDMLLERI